MFRLSTLKLRGAPWLILGVIFTEVEITGRLEKVAVFETALDVMWIEEGVGVIELVIVGEIAAVSIICRALMVGANGICISESDIVGVTDGVKVIELKGVGARDGI